MRGNGNTDGSSDWVSRRAFLRVSSGALTAAGVTTLGYPVQAQDAPYDGYLSDTDNFDGTTVDMTGRNKVTVDVGVQGNDGAFAYDPPAVNVDPGTTVVWEWTGKGGQHNVVAEDGTFESNLVSEEGYIFERTFNEPGIIKYYCTPHKGLGMKGVVAVGNTAEGEFVPPGERVENRGESGGEGGGSVSSDSAPEGEGGSAGPESELVHQGILLLYSILGLTAVMALLPEIIAAPTVVKRSVSIMGMKLQAFNDFRDHLITSTVIGWMTVLAILLLGSGLIVGLWTVIGNPLVFLGAFALLVFLVAVYAAKSIGVRLGVNPSVPSGSKPQITGSGGTSLGITPEDSSKVAFSRTLDVVRGWIGSTLLFVVGIALVVALWTVSGGGLAFLLAVFLVGMVIVSYVVDNIR